MNAPEGMFGRGRRVMPGDVLLPEEEHGLNGDSKVTPLPKRGIGEFTVPPDEDPSVLLGNRYLCRGDGLVMVSSSGMGKSALSIQAAVTWALGRAFMGIRPNGCLRSLIIQSEDSDGDIGEVWESICYKMALTAEERALVSERVVIVSDRVHRGLLFIGELKRQLDGQKYDLVWINPLAAFISGDATTQEATAEFLRAGLNSLNTPGAFGYIIVQHTTKPATGKERGERKWFEVMYDMAGSYDIVGWARCIISLRPTDTHGEFNLVLAKRGSRAGVTKRTPQGTGYKLESTLIIPLRHCQEKMPVVGIKREVSVIFWEPREEVATDEQPPERQNGRPKRNSIDDFIGVFPVGLKNAIGINALLQSALKVRHIAKGTLYSVITDGLQQKKIVCNSSDPKLPVYYIPAPISDQSEDETWERSETSQ